MQKLTLLTLIMILLFSFSRQSMCQSNPTSKNPTFYKTQVSVLDNPFILIRGYLSEVNESSIVISNKSGEDHQHIQISNVDKIKFRKHGNINNGIWYGFLTGLGSGILIGLISGDDTENDFFLLTAKQKAVVLGATFAFYGGWIGSIIGARKKKISIKGNQSTYVKHKEKLRQYLLIQ